ncbi:hypothetical protein [Neoroseomonas lacus]|uniref:Uncharacterized protein n=1 Tax=Neoroseomonas lacus TaxID=287609 RepID=A0A917KIR4_9PROT|nr:hypothetical protein [Neoroseomonas lacus]GGJ13876.1 hypothetical protein GCM10011320_21350 [Neoroseomonas lacus]
MHPRPTHFAPEPIQINAADFFSLTNRMAPAGVGGLMRLIAQLDLLGSLPGDDVSCMFMGGMTEEEWSPSGFGPRGFFVRCPDGRRRLAPEFKRVIRLRPECVARWPRQATTAAPATYSAADGSAEVAPSRSVNARGV